MLLPSNGKTIHLLNRLSAAGFFIGMMIVLAHFVQTQG